MVSIETTASLPVPGASVATHTIGICAHDRDLRPRRPANPPPETSRPAGKHDDAIDLCLQRRLEDLLVTIAQLRVGAVFELDILHAKGARFLLDTGTHFVPERCRAPQRVYRDAQFSLLGQVASRSVGPITESLGHLQHASFRDGIDAFVVVQGTVNGSGGDSERIRDVDERGFIALHKGRQFGALPAGQQTVSAHGTAGLLLGFPDLAPSDYTSSNQ